MSLIYIDFMSDIALNIKTNILKPDEEGCLKAVQILRRQGIVALPTETVYGLAGNAWSATALAKIYRAKDRPADNPLIWHVNNAEKALALFDRSSMSAKIKKRCDLLIERCWPGPLTMVAKKSPDIKSSLSTVAVRVPNNPLTLGVLELLSFPLAMPSANLSSRPSPTTARHVLKTLYGRIDAVIDGGPCAGGLESTVVLVDEEELTILRPGLISRCELEFIVGEKISLSAGPSIPLSPGQAYLHYSPRVEKIALLNREEAYTAWNEGHTIIVRKNDEAQLRQRFGTRDPKALTLVLPDEPQSFATELYKALYEAEERPKSQLTLIAPPAGEEWVAILDRLARSAGAKGTAY